MNIFGLKVAVNTIPGHGSYGAGQAVLFIIKPDFPGNLAAAVLPYKAFDTIVLFLAQSLITEGTVFKIMAGAYVRRCRRLQPREEQ
jgi:hypothetical protein